MALENVRVLSFKLADILMILSLIVYYVSLTCSTNTRKGRKMSQDK